MATRPKKKVIITCAVTGAIHTPTMSPYLPITPQEKQALLETNDTDARMTRLRELLLAHGIIEKINKNNG